MSSNNLELEFEIRKLKSVNVELNMKLKTLEKKLNAKTTKEVQSIESKYKEQVKSLQRELKIKIDLNQRLQKKLILQEEKINEKDAIIAELKNKLIDQQKELDNVKRDNQKYEAKLNSDGTTEGVPTSQTPIHKDKIIPNTRTKGGKKGGQKGHPKHKLEKFDNNEINETKEITLEACPHCHCKKLEKLNSSVDKDEFDYEIRIIKRRNKFIKYECPECHKIVKANIPDDLKEENQYGKYVQASALSLTNMANVPFNKTRRIISGLTTNEINLSEGYIAKLQKRASRLLKPFIEDLNNYLINLNILYWDDTVIFVNTKRACLRFYGDNNVSLYTAHETKGKTGLDSDNILNRLSKETKLVHDHNKVNYNTDYVHVNVECCQHLERDLEKVKLNIVDSTWSKSLKDLFSSYDHKRNEYMKSNIDSFSLEETNEFMINFDRYILLGLEENKQHGKSHYFKEERALLKRLMEYRDNYTYWLYDFSIPYTNNTSERALRGVKTKMKVSGQFENINYAEYYADIKSYIETCHRNGINEVEALVRLLNGNPVTVHEIFGDTENTKEE